MDPHEETALESVVELLALQDVARVPDEEAAHRVDQPGLSGQERVRTNSRPGCGRGNLWTRRPPLVRIAQHGERYATWSARRRSGQEWPGKCSRMVEIVIRQPLDVCPRHSPGCSTTSNWVHDAQRISAGRAWRVTDLYMVGDGGIRSPVGAGRSVAPLTAARRHGLGSHPADTEAAISEARTAFDEGPWPRPRSASAARCCCAWRTC